MAIQTISGLYGMSSAEYEDGVKAMNEYAAAMNALGQGIVVSGNVGPLPFTPPSNPQPNPTLLLLGDEE